MSESKNENLEAFNMIEAISDMEKEIDNCFDKFLNNEELIKVSQSRLSF